MTGHYSPEFVAEVVARARIAEVVGARLALIRNGREFVALCPFHADRKPSLTVVPAKGFYKCFACGAFGDAIGFLREYEGWPFARAVAELAYLAGLADDPGGSRRRRERRTPPPAADPRAEAAHRIGLVRDLKARSVPIAGTLAEAYLRNRGLDVDALADRLGALRFVDRLAYTHDGRHGSVGRTWHPALLGFAKALDGRVTGCTRIYLGPYGTKAFREGAKRFAGVVTGACVRFGPAAARMGGAEGVETTGSLIPAAPGLSFWCPLSLGAFAGPGAGRGRPHPLRPGMTLPSELPDMRRPGLALPECCEAFAWFGDGDSGDPLAAEALHRRGLRRLAAEGRRGELVRAPDGADWNDVLSRAA